MRNPIREVNEDQVNEPKVDENEVKELLQYKDSVIETLSALLKIVESNPLIVNKYIVASVEDLSSLIKLLTNANEVHIYLSDDVECTCVNSVSFGGPTIFCKLDFQLHLGIIASRHINSSYFYILPFIIFGPLNTLLHHCIISFSTLNLHLFIFSFFPYPLHHYY